MLSYRWLPVTCIQSSEAGRRAFPGKISSYLKEMGKEIACGEARRTSGIGGAAGVLYLTEVQIISVDTFVKTQKGIAEGMAQ